MGLRTMHTLYLLANCKSEQFSHNDSMNPTPPKKKNTVMEDKRITQSLQSKSTVNLCNIVVQGTKRYILLIKSVMSSKGYKGMFP